MIGLIEAAIFRCSMTYGLAIHTASPDLGLAVSNFKDDRRHQVWNLGRDLSTHFQVHLAEFMTPYAWTDLAFIAVAKGPGGFTGTRLGVVTARALAQQLDLPLFAISTLQAFAQSEQSQIPTDRAIAVQMLAQRGEIFGGIYQSLGTDLVPLQADSLFSPEMWQACLAQHPTPYCLLHAENGFGDSVTSVLDLAYSAWQRGDRPHWSLGLPFYGQHPVHF
jgi:tRNA threonylcarbamoyl adenosine modification protein YeaZ